MLPESRCNRRRFLAGAAAAAGTLTLPYFISASALGQEGRPAPSARVTLGAIGVGGRGTGDLQGLMTDKRVQALAVCDVQTRSRDNAQKIVNQYYGADKEYRGCKPFGDFRELLADKSIDAVMIATPDHWHAITAIEAVKAGKAVYCEKPLSLTIQHGRKMVEAVKRYGAVFQTGTQQRSDQEFRRACELVRNGRVGKLKTIEVEIPGSMSIDGDYFEPVPPGIDYEMWLGPAPMAPYSPKRVDAFGWRWIFDYAGGCVTDWGAHHMDIAQWAMGTTLTGPTEVEGKAVFPTKGLFNTALHWHYEARYENGVTVINFAKDEFRNQYPNGITFTGDKGTLFVARGQIWSKPESILKEQIGPDEIQLYKSDDHYRNFIDAIITKVPPAAPIEEAHRSVSVCHLANIAMRLGRKVRWNPATEQIADDPDASEMLTRPMRAPWRI